ncbi:MAG: hypothetical protein K2M48_05420 [Clostridiales bacterium]|nr:hypothetical protein [Clostridiales bacterium]
MEKIKVLFLDIDGVLCLHEEGVVNWGENTNDDVFDEQCCRRLKEIIEATDCKLALSSFWRLQKRDCLNILRQLKPFGITSADFIGGTPLMDHRGDEVMTFIERHPEIGTFVAVDDEDYSGDRFPADRLVLTQLERGITESAKELIIQKLNGASD